VLLSTPKVVGVPAWLRIAAWRRKAFVTLALHLIDHTLRY
jgi:hypothetical protein